MQILNTSANYSPVDDVRLLNQKKILSLFSCFSGYRLTNLYIRHSKNGKNTVMNEKYSCRFNYAVEYNSINLQNCDLSPVALSLYSVPKSFWNNYIFYYDI